MPPPWLTVLAWLSLAVSVATAAAIVYDIRGRGHRQPMRIMEWVWPVTALTVFALGLEIAGLALYAEYAVNFTFAFALGILFQYAAIRPMGDLGRRAALKAALKADALSLLAFEVGVFGAMAVIQLVLFPDPHLTPDHAAYWMLMQVAMVLGFATAYPANVWLVRRGIKEGM